VRNYLVAYTVTDYYGKHVGIGTVVRLMHVPRDAQGVRALSDQVTLFQRDARAIGSNHQVAVTGWSEMGA
jgi:hypothetical protein